MCTESNKNNLILILLIGINILTINCATLGHQEQNHQQHQLQTQQQINEKIIQTPDEISPAGRALFSPRVDYNEWMPLGRGDPLKNDPTYDYSPPVLDRVRYWGGIESQQHQQQQQQLLSGKEKGDILLLGVPSKKPTARKDAKHVPVRRNYYTQLPTHLMPPPPMQAQVNKQSQLGDSVTAQSSNSYQHLGPVPYSTQNGWPLQSSVSDSNADTSNSFISISRPNHMTPSQSSLYSVTSVQSNRSSDNTMNIPLMSTGIQVGSYSETAPYYPKKPLLLTILQNEQQTIKGTSNNVAIEPSQSLIHIKTTDFGRYESTTTQPNTINGPTIPPQAMTTDSLFSHYKQPSEPIRGPMYLIIQGHSKVITYGSHENGTTKHMPKIVPVVKMDDPVIRHVVSHDDLGHEAIVKHLHKKQVDEKINERKPKPEKSSIGSLLSLLESSFGSFLDAEEQSTNRPNSIENELKTNEKFKEKDLGNRRARNIPDIKEAELTSSYSVGETGKTFYQPGFVETEIISRTKVFKLE